MHKLAAAFILIFSLMSPTSYAGDTPPSCDQVLTACDKALTEQLKTVKLQKDLLTTMDLRTNVLVEQNNRLQSEASAWYHNPLVVGPLSFTLGALAAIYITSRINH